MQRTCGQAIWSFHHTDDALPTLDAQSSRVCRSCEAAGRAALVSLTPHKYSPTVPPSSRVERVMTTIETALRPWDGGAAACSASRGCRARLLVACMTSSWGATTRPSATGSRPNGKSLRRHFICTSALSIASRIRRHASGASVHPSRVQPVLAPCPCHWHSSLPLHTPGPCATPPTLVLRALSAI